MTLSPIVTVPLDTSLGSAMRHHSLRALDTPLEHLTSLLYNHKGDSFLQIAHKFRKLYQAVLHPGGTGNSGAVFLSLGRPATSPLSLARPHCFIYTHTHMCKLTECGELSESARSPNLHTIRKHIESPTLIQPFRTQFHVVDGELSYLAVNLECSACLQRGAALEPSVERGRGSGGRAAHGEGAVSEGQLRADEMLRYAGRNCCRMQFAFLGHIFFFLNGSWGNSWEANALNILCHFYNIHSSNHSKITA